MIDRETNWWTETERDPAHLAAADWLVRLRNPEVSLEETLAWQAWMKEDPCHAQAFERVEAVAELMPHVRPPREPAPRELARDTYDASTSLKEWRAPQRRERTLAMAASLALLAAGASFAVYFGSSTLRSDVPSYEVATMVGENRTISLRDGSKITLGGDTRVAIALSDSLRDIELSRGEALFTVAKDPLRPFKVRAGNATVVAVGTEFNVRRASDRAIVSVTEGRVIVEPIGHLLPVALLREFKPKLRPVHLDAGQQTMADDAGIGSATRIEDPAAATSWQSGQLAFRLQPLRYVLEDVNRYAPKPIVLDDQDLGTLLITGMVTRENVDGWIESLERGFALRATEEPDRIVLGRR